MPESKTDLKEPLPETIGDAPEKKEEQKPDPLAELEARLTAKFQKEIESRDDKIAALSKPIQQPGPTVVEKIDIYEKLGTKLWENTPEAMRELRNEIKKEVTSELRGEYQSARSEEKFWDAFYRDNKILNRDEDHWVAEAIVRENFSAWKDMPVAKVRDELAKEAEKRLARMEARKERKGDDKAPSLSLSSASAPSPKKEVTEEKPRTLSQMLRDRQQQRQTALFKRQEDRTRDNQGRFRKEQVN